MSDSSQPQPHVSFNLPSEASQDDEPEGFRNHYLPMTPVKSNGSNSDPPQLTPLQPLPPPPPPPPPPPSSSHELSSPTSPDHTEHYTTTRSISSNYTPTSTLTSSLEFHGDYPMAHTNEIIDQSKFHDTEQVVEVSPNQRYMRMNALLGKGAYKIVYKAIDREEGYEVAWNTVQTAPKGLDKEIEILKSVRHPNIIAFHDAWYQTDNEFVFITELMTSGTLREYIRKLSLPNLKIVKRWSRQILKGLAYLHNYNPPIIHRDIKCDNIFINGAHGEVKIGDMGTAEMKMGKKYTIIGTPEFMAPEMYEELGYSEKVDIYAFGMCLLEMATGEYPYGECKNAAQVYKKVSSGVKPGCLQKVQNPEMLSIIENCLGPEEERFSAQEILEHSFLALEPDVVLLAADPTHVHLTLQVVFKGLDKLSVKFDFNVDTDTAEQVVREMIEEQVLPERYQHHITKEINRILRDLEKPTAESDSSGTARQQSIWRRDTDSRTEENDALGSELERVLLELERTAEHARDVEAKCENYETIARTAESRYRDAMRSLQELKAEIEATKAATGHFPHGDETAAIMALMEKHPDLPSARDALVSGILEEYADDTPIEVFVQDCARVSHRNADKAHEWSIKLKNQDIMTVGDLRDLHDEDWAGIGLTVFALRALKNLLRGKRLANISTSFSPLANSGAMTPATSTPSTRLSPSP